MRRLIHIPNLRVILPAVIAVLLFAAALFFIILPEVKTSLMERKRELTKEQTATAMATLSWYHSLETQGKLTRTEAQAQAAEHIRGLRYGEDMKSYFWINDTVPTMIMHPYVPALEGQRVDTMTDARGTALFMLFKSEAKDSNGAYVQYWWQWNDDSSLLAPKLSYIRLFEPWQWIIGTGVYTQDIEAEVAQISRRLVLIALAIVIVLFLLLSFMVREGLRLDSERTTTAEKLRLTRLSMNRTGEIALWVDRDGRIVDLNLAACRRLGYTRNRLLALTLFDIDRTLTKASWDQRWEDRTSGESRHFESEFVCKDGTYIPVEVGADYIEFGSHSVFLILARDIAERRRAEDALRRSEESYRAVVEEQTELICRATPDAVLTFVNTTFARYFGAEVDTLIGSSLFEQIPLERQEQVRRSLNALSENQPVNTLEHDMVDANGNVRWLSWSNRALFDIRGRIVEYLAVARDVTELKRTEHALLANAQRLSMHIQQTPLGVIEWNLALEVTEWNPGAELIFGYSRTDMLGQRALDRISPGSLGDGAIRTWNRLVETREGCRTSGEHRTRTGDWVWCEWYNTPLVDRDGALIGIASLVLDKTAQRRATEQLAQSEERYRRIYNKSPIMLHSIDEDGVIVRVSDYWLATMGYEAHQVIGHSITEFLAEESDPTIENTLVSDSFRTGACMNRPARFRTASGDILDILVSAIPEGDTGEELRTSLTVMVNITDRKRAERELHEAQEEYRVIFNSVPAMIWYKDTDDRILRINEAAARLAGRKPSSIKGKIASEVYSGLPESYRSDELEVIESGMTKYGVIERFIAESGEAHWIRADKVPLCDSEGNVTRILVIAQDVTSLIETEEALRESEERFRLLFESAPLGILSVDTKGNVLDINPTFFRIVGSPARVNADRMRIEDFGPLKQVGIESEINECLTSGRPIADEGSYTNQWGSRVYLRYLITPLQTEAGRFTGLQIMIEDVTDRVQSEQELKKLSAAVNQSANAICITDLFGTIEYVNPLFSKLTGYSIMEVVGRPISMMQSGEHDAAFYEDLWSTIKAGRIWSGQMHNRKKSGKFFWERKTISPIFNEKNEIMSYLSIGEDITLELQTQQKLAQSDKLAAIGMLAAGVAHEFKNYLGGIIGNATYAIDELPDDGGIARETLAQIVDMGERANQVAMSLLTYSKTQSNEVASEDLRQIIQNTLRLIGKEIKNRGIEIVTFFTDAPLVQVSAGKIQQLLLNLIINAEHAIAGEGIITISLITRPENILLTVSDTGCGISADDTERIFDPFFSTKGVWGKDKLVGSGMGLAICRNIAREHGGDLTVDSYPNVGSSFTLSMPITRSSDEYNQAMRQGANGIHLLLFSLDTEVMETYRENNAGTPVTMQIVNTAEALLEALDWSDVLVCDARFSGKMELLRATEHATHAHIPYVMVRCEAMEYQLKEIYDNAATCFRSLPPVDRLLLALESHSRLRAPGPLSPRLPSAD